MWDYCFNTIQYDIDLKHIGWYASLNNSFNTIQYDIDLKLTNRVVVVLLCFNTIQYDIDLKPKSDATAASTVLIPFNMT